MKPKTDAKIQPNWQICCQLNTVFTKDGTEGLMQRRKRWTYVGQADEDVVPAKGFDEKHADVEAGTDGEEVEGQEQDHDPGQALLVSHLGYLSFVCAIGRACMLKLMWISTKRVEWASLGWKRAMRDTDQKGETPKSA